MDGDEVPNNSASEGDKCTISNDTQRIYKDEVDRFPNKCHVTNWDIFVLMMSIFSHVGDVALDINLAYRYFKNNQTTYFLLTVLFIYFPSLVNTFISHRMYVLSEGDVSSSRMVVKKWTVRIFVLIFQLAPVLRYCDSVDYAIKSRAAEREMDIPEQVRYYELMLKEDSEVALLRVLECYLEAAPQQILQIAIILINVQSNSQDTRTLFLIHQCGSISTSLFSMAWSMASYHRSIRLCQRDKSNLSLTGTAVQFMWHFMVTVSRILSIGVLASLYSIATAVACLIHWITMTFWLALWENTQFVAPDSTWRAKLSEIFFCGILGLVYIFTYLTPGEGATRHRYLIYYPLCFFENVTAVIVWAIFSNSKVKSSWYYIPMIVSGIVPFIVGIGFMSIFYKLLHPQTSSRRVHTSGTVKSDVAIGTSTISLAA